jgi:hypothetical protein
LLPIPMMSGSLCKVSCSLLDAMLGAMQFSMRAAGLYDAPRTRAAASCEQQPQPRPSELAFGAAPATTCMRAYAYAYAYAYVYTK